MINRSLNCAPTNRAQFCASSSRLGNSDSKLWSALPVNKNDKKETKSNTPRIISKLPKIPSLYKKARLGEIKNMTGISAPYEEPKNPNIEIKTEKVTVEQAANKIIEYIVSKLELSHE